MVDCLDCADDSAKKVCLVAPADCPSYEEATMEQREYGFFCDDDGTMPDGSDGYVFGK